MSYEAIVLALKRGVLDSAWRFKTTMPRVGQLQSVRAVEDGAPPPALMEVATTKVYKSSRVLNILRGLPIHSCLESKQSFKGGILTFNPASSELDLVNPGSDHLINHQTTSVSPPSPRRDW